jgi:two-component system cell cycle response regulator CtrA
MTALVLPWIVDFAALRKTAPLPTTPLFPKRRRDKNAGVVEAGAGRDVSSPLGRRANPIQCKLLPLRARLTAAYRLGEASDSLLSQSLLSSCVARSPFSARIKISGRIAGASEGLLTNSAYRQNLDGKSRRTRGLVRDRRAPMGARDQFDGARWGTNMRVLLIEDDSATAQSIELMLKSENFNVYTTDLGEEGIDLGKLYDYDIILLDLNLPDMSGYEVLRHLRVAKVKTPILILSGLAGIEDKVKGLGFGADDYLTKPFHKDELVARIHAIVRRSKGHAQSVITTGDLIVNLDQKTVEVGGARVHLTGKEYQMLELLSLRKGTTLTKEMFLNHLYGGMDEPELKIIDVFICKLRKKLANASDGRNYIETVWGRGYVLREPSEADERITA